MVDSKPETVMEINNDVIESLLSTSIASMNKPDLQTKCKEFQDALKALYDEKVNSSSQQNAALDGILDRLSALEKKENDNSDAITKLRYENKTLRNRIQELEGYMEDVDSRIVDAEKAVTSVEQYTRRENFEIAGIPTNIPHDQLKQRVIDIANSICERSAPITARDIHACHRLKEDNGQAAVIVRMVNREDTVNILKSKKKLPEKSTSNLGYQQKLFINENLCNGTKDIYSVARELKKKKLINSCWTFNGVVHFKKRESDPKGKKVFHLSEFENYFTLSQLGWE